MKKKVVCFGEALWDNFPDYKEIGGAPLNVAYHLNKLGVDFPIASVDTSHLIHKLSQESEYYLKIKQ